MKNLHKLIMLFLFIPFLSFAEENKQFESDDFIFESPRPLLNNSNESAEYFGAMGADLIFSNSGFALGYFYNIELDDDLVAFANIFVSGARNTDEFEGIDINGNLIVPNKVNRLYKVPLTFGVTKYVLGDVLFENFKPFLNAGVGPSLILSTPYEKEFFSSFKYARAYYRFASFIGTGAQIGSVGSNYLTLNVRYYYIPFGGDGLESIKASPIKDFGGITLSLSIGYRF